MPGLDGVALQEKTTRATPDILVVVITTYGSIDSANGVHNYITKPFGNDQIRRTAEKILTFFDLRRENHSLR